MKNKTLIALVIAGVVLLPNAAYAKDNNKVQNNKAHIAESNKDNNNSNEDENADESSDSSNNSEISQPSENNIKGTDKKQANEAKRNAKSAEIQSFKAEIKSKHAAIAQLRDEIKPIRQQVEVKTAELTSIIKDIQAGKKTLPEDMLNNLITLTDTLKSDSAALKSTSEVNTDTTSAQDDVKKQNFNNALASMDKVIAKFQQRLASLEKLNSDLDAALKIAESATEVTVQDPAANSDNSNTSTTTTSDDSISDGGSPTVEGN